LAFQFSFYVAGFIVLIGMLWGRFAYGWLHLFRLIQDLLCCIPSPKFLLPLWSRYFKYVILIDPDFFRIAAAGVAQRIYRLGRALLLQMALSGGHPRGGSTALQSDMTAVLQHVWAMR
jgi:hypothetical protein